MQVSCPRPMPLLPPCPSTSMHRQCTDGSRVRFRRVHRRRLKVNTSKCDVDCASLAWLHLCQLTPHADGVARVRACRERARSADATSGLPCQDVQRGRYTCVPQGSIATVYRSESRLCVKECSQPRPLRALRMSERSCRLMHNRAPRSAWHETIWLAEYTPAVQLYR
jgi:hypothetical protein